MRRSHWSISGGGGGGSGGVFGSAQMGGAATGGSGMTHRSRACLSAAFLCIIMAVVVVLPPMKPKTFLAENAEVEGIQRILDSHQRHQVLDAEDDTEPHAADHHGGSQGSGNSRPRKIDLTIYIVFHKVLRKEMYSAIDWRDISYPGGAASAVKKDGTSGEIENKPTTLDTGSVVSALSAPGGANRTTVIFVATNKNIRKRYDGDLVRGRLMKEWELPGYDSRIGNTMNEFGAMNSIFSSQLTQHAGNIANVAGRSSSARLIAADADGDGVQEWIGVFQYDMRIDSKLINSIRRRIVTKTAAAVGVQLRRAGGIRSDLGAVVPQPHTLHCCIFYGLSYPSKYLLHNALGRRLLDDYNAFFMTQFTLHDLPPNAILDAFVVPTIVFNHFAPFLESTMLRAIRNPAAYPRQPSRADRQPPISPSSLSTTNGAGSNNSSGGAVSGPTTSPTANTANTGKHQSFSSSAHALDVMEAALALALGLETSFVQIQLPLRHKIWD